MVRVRQVGPALGEFGMLVAATEVQGSGVGRALVAFAEDWARRRELPVLRLELLVPVEGEHPVKEFLRSWYTRIGYRQVSTGDLGAAYPDLVPWLATPCRLLAFHKHLR
jgi:GNAT superfamily N-acetyltransferase